MRNSDVVTHIVKQDPGKPFDALTMTVEVVGPKSSGNKNNGASQSYQQLRGG